jgi:diacylglycerol kinase family enzyme
LNWLVIVNKKAGWGSASRLWNRTESMLLNAGIDFTAKFTEAPAQTRLLSANALNLGYGGVAVFGGDGTVSDAAAAISGNLEKPVLAFLPAGSGNDWIRSLGFNPGHMEECISAMSRGKTGLIDSGLCRWPGGSRFFLNSAGAGFDALVLKRAIAIRRFLPFTGLNYMLSLTASAIIPPRWNATLFCDGVPFYKGDYLSLTVGIGRYSGGGMILSPLSLPDDGFLDALCLSPMNFFQIAQNFNRVFNGTLNETKKATCAKGSVIRLEPSKAGSVILELDGEKVFPGKNAEYIEFVSRPGDLTVIVPSE